MVGQVVLGETFDITTVVDQSHICAILTFILHPFVLVSLMARFHIAPIPNNVEGCGCEQGGSHNDLCDLCSVGVRCQYFRRHDCERMALYPILPKQFREDAFYTLSVFWFWA